MTDLAEIVHREAARALGLYRDTPLDDLRQQGWVGALKAHETYDPEKGPFDPHAVMTVRRGIMDQQKAKRNRAFTTFDPTVHNYAPLTEDPDPALLDEAQLALRQAGSYQAATALWLHHALGYTFAEMGEIMRLSPSRCHQIVTDAKARVRASRE